MVLKIKKDGLKEIIKHCEEELPLEACGILTGIKKKSERIVERIYKTRNILKSSNRYQIDPQQQLKIFIEADERGFDILGFYHSHPSFSAQISTIDIESANYPSCTYLIYSNRDKEFKSFLWNGKKFENEKMDVI